MRIMLFGAAGQVGSSCALAIQKMGYELVAVTRKELDFADASQVKAWVLRSQPDVVINACAYTAVDKAEKEVVLADQINHLSVASLASACNAVEAMLIHLSTDYVFDGCASTPYDEGSEVNPLSVYGATKLAGENAIVSTLGKYIILRTSWVFGENGNNFVKTMLRLGGERDQLSVVSDQFGKPTYVGHIVDVIMTLIERYGSEAELVWGVYHCSSSGETNWCEFARAIFDLAYQKGRLSLLPKVEAITSAEYPTPAPRPMYSVLDAQKLERVLGRSMPPWREGLLSFFS